MPRKWGRGHGGGADERSMALRWASRPDLCLDLARPTERNALRGREAPRRANVGDRRLCPLVFGPRAAEQGLDNPNPAGRRSTASQTGIAWPANYPDMTRQGDPARAVP